MKKGFILVNAYTDNGNELHQPMRIKEALEQIGVQVNIVRNSPAALEEGGEFCVFLDKDKYTARKLERRMRLFNRASAIEVCDDKMLTQIALENRFPMPRTIASSLCYTPRCQVPESFIKVLEEELNYPIVVKECHGSLGRQVYLARNREELVELAERLKTVPHLFQKFISESAGQDIRVIVIGGKAVAAMRRVSDGDFRSNASLGGRGELYPVDESIKSLCEQVSKTLCLDYCGIDLLLGRDGYLVCEVNSNAFFGTFERVTGIDVAAMYARHIYAEVYGKN